MTSAPVSRVSDLLPGASAASALPVSELTHGARDVLEGAFPPLWVRGEICDFKRHRNGQWYFGLRDPVASVRCVVWSRDQWRIPALPEDGMQVAALGQLSVYPARGEMQFTVRQLEADGEGLWRKALEQTRARLEADGLLDPRRKRPIPRFPRRIAVVTSASGAALHDIIAVTRRRHAGVEIVLVPARVQGEGAPQSLCAALARVARWGEADVVIVGRGGGSREDLWAFNDERVARAVAGCPMPTISAIGHEIDITMCDLVADLRAPTPSAAAESTVPVREEIVARLRELAGALRESADGRFGRARSDLSQLARTLSHRAERVAERRRARLDAIAGRLDAMSPLRTLARGFVIARDADGRTRKSVADFSPGDRFELMLRDGRVAASTVRVDGSDQRDRREDGGTSTAGLRPPPSP